MPDLDENNQGEAENKGSETQPELSFESWLESQDETVKTLLATHTTGLTNALKSERNERRRLESEIKQTAKKVEEGSETRQNLDKLAAELEESERRATFYEQAATAGIRNPKLAYIAARDANMLNNDGSPMVDKLKAEYPELFERKPSPPGNAGAGTAGAAPKLSGNQAMNDFIRKSLGRD